MWGKVPNLKDKMTNFDEILIAQRNNQIQINGSYNLSELTDRVLEEGTGTVTNANGEFKLSYQASNDLAGLLTSDRGRYVPGHPAECGIGARFPQLPTGDIEGIVGYFDTTETNTINEGATFEYDSEGMYVALYHNGEQRIRVHEDEWNLIDNIDINYNKGWIFQINFVYYGYGAVTFQLMNPYTREITKLHEYIPKQETTFFNSNLRISSLLRGTISDTYDMFISGRQFSIIGEDNPNVRNISHYTGVKTLTGGQWDTVTTVRKKADMKAINIALEGFETRTNPDLRYEILVNTTLDGTGTWETLDRQHESEVGIEVNDTAQVTNQNTSLPDGYKVAEGFISGADNRSSLVLRDEGITVNLPDEYNVSLLVYAESAGDAEFIFKVNENR